MNRYTNHPRGLVLKRNALAAAFREIGMPREKALSEATRILSGKVEPHEVTRLKEAHHVASKRIAQARGIKYLKRKAQNVKRNAASAHPHKHP